MPTAKPRRVRTRRTFTKEFKLQVLRELDAGSTIAELARVHDVHPETIRVWSKMERKYGSRSFAGRGRAYTDEARIAQLERALGQVTLENSLLEKALASLKELDRRNGGKR
jgi:transposase